MYIWYVYESFNIILNLCVNSFLKLFLIQKILRHKDLSLILYKTTYLVRSAVNLTIFPRCSYSQKKLVSNNLNLNNCSMGEWKTFDNQ